MGEMSAEVERQILDRLTTIEVMLRGALDSRDDHEARLRAIEQTQVEPKRVERIEERVRGVETWKWKMTGLGAGVGALLGGAAGATASTLIGG